MTTGDLQLLASRGDTATSSTPQLAALYVCNSGVGHATAEAVLGPTWALLWAGVPCVVSCNWEAWSGVAAKHAEFLAESLADGADVAAAMQSAALRLIALEEFSAPHYWACLRVTSITRLAVSPILPRPLPPHPLLHCCPGHHGHLLRRGQLAPPPDPGLRLLQLPCRHTTTFVPSGCGPGAWYPWPLKWTEQW